MQCYDYLSKLMLWIFKRKGQDKREWQTLQSHMIEDERVCDIGRGRDRETERLRTTQLW